MVMFKGKGCAECPFYHEDLDDGGNIIDQWCSLDGMEELGGHELNIELERDGKRKGDCPFYTRGPGQIEVGCIDD